MSREGLFAADQNMAHDDEAFPENNNEPPSAA
jgi:hypothetical protein